MRTISRYVAGGAVNSDTNVATDVASDAWGQRIRTTRHVRDASGSDLGDHVSASTYDALGNVTASIANYADGVVSSGGSDVTPDTTTGVRTDLTTTYGYDTAGNQVSAADPRRAIYAATPGSPGPDDFASRQTYDPLNRSVSATTPTAPGVTITQHTSTTSYDELGGIREATDFSGAVTGTAYDRTGRPLATFEDPDGPGATAAYQTSETTYADASRSVTTRDQAQLANAALGSTVTTADELGRVVSVTEASGATLGTPSTTTTTYDALGRVTVTTVGAGTSTRQTTTTAYDAGGRVTSVDDGFACTTNSYTFDHLDKVTMGLTGGTCAKGAGDHWREVTHTLDALGRETAATQTDASDDVGNGDQVSAATYDALGSVLDRSSYVAATLTRTGSTFTLNILGQVITEAHYHTVSGTRTADATAKATFDAVGNPVDACFWKAGIAVDVCRTAGNPPANPPTTVTSTVYDARNNRVAQTTLATDGTTLSGTTLYNPDADYQPAAVYTPTKMSGGTVAAELQTCPASRFLDTFGLGKL